MSHFLTTRTKDFNVQNNKLYLKSEKIERSEFKDNS